MLAANFSLALWVKIGLFTYTNPGFSKYFNRPLLHAMLCLCQLLWRQKKSSLGLSMVQVWQWNTQTCLKLFKDCLSSSYHIIRTFIISRGQFACTTSCVTQPSTKTIQSNYKNYSTGYYWPDIRSQAITLRDWVGNTVSLYFCSQRGPSACDSTLSTVILFFFSSCYSLQHVEETEN